MHRMGLRLLFNILIVLFRALNVLGRQRFLKINFIFFPVHKNAIWRLRIFFLIKKKKKKINTSTYIDQEHLIDSALT